MPSTENVANVANDVVNVATVINGYTLTESEKSVYEFIFSHVNASTKEISEATGVTVRTVQRSIKELENHQIIKKPVQKQELSGLFCK